MMIEIVLEIHDGTEHVRRRPFLTDSVPEEGDIISHVKENDDREYEVTRIHREMLPTPTIVVRVQRPQQLGTMPIREL
jgi:hypothetical protein